MKSQLIYLQNSDKVDIEINEEFQSNSDKIASGDILKIDIQTSVNEAAIPYNSIYNKIPVQNLDAVRLEGYLVDKNNNINFPVLGKIHAGGFTVAELENVITKMLIEGRHLINPTVKVRRINSKFTVLGEVRNPGTFTYIDQELTIFQALGYAGDLTIDAKRNDLTLIRHVNGDRQIYKVELRDANLLNMPTYFIKNNDVIIANPSFNKVKSAGFIGSPSSIASMASLLLSITLLITNN